MCQYTLVASKIPTFVLLCIVTIHLSAFPGTNYAVAGDAEDIVGRWDLVKVDGKPVDAEVRGTRYIRFNSDGTFKSVIPFFNTTDGRYKFVSDKVIEIDLPGIIYGRNKEEAKYTLKDDTFRLIRPFEPPSDWEFVKVDKGN